MTTLTRRQQRGFATYTAIILMTFVALTLAVVAVSFAADARRTRSNTAEAQLRQLLTAGGAAAMRQLDHASAATPIDVALPAEMASDDAKLTLTLSHPDDNHADAIVHAQLGRRSMEQSLRFERRDGKWQPIAATLAVP